VYLEQKPRNSTIEKQEENIGGGETKRKTAGDMRGKLRQGISSRERIQGIEAKAVGTPRGEDERGYRGGGQASSDCKAGLLSEIRFHNGKL